MENGNTKILEMPVSVSYDNAALLIDYKYKVSTKSTVIYMVTVLAVIIALSSLPFIYTEISIRSPGIIRSEIEKSELLASVSGRVIKINMKDNQKLTRGDTLLVIDASVPGKQAYLLEQRSFQTGRLLKDVNQLLAFADRKEAPETNLGTNQYKASLRHFLQEREEKRNSKDQAERVFMRYRDLYTNNVLSKSEFEQFKFEYDQANSAYALLTDRYRSQWQQDATGFRDELRQFEGQRAELAEQKGSYILRAPVNGSVQNVSGVQTGTYVFANQKIGEISPDTRLLAFCYVKPSDIGLIRIGQQVSFRINAFNYNQWGLLSGKVTDISDDVIWINEGQPVFKVKCSLDKDYLQLKNEYKGLLKKGMNFSAHFIIARRSLFELLYDKVDDWVNPTNT